MSDFTFATTVDFGGRHVTVTAATPASLDQGVAQTRGHWGQRTPTPATPPPLPPTPTPGGHRCEHGERVHKNGQSKSTGKAWSGWFCPLPRERQDEQCAVEWA
jgi:hypothetical protein